MLSNAFAAAALGLMSLLPGVRAGFNPVSTSNIAVYWGQNSVGTLTSQQHLSYYCQNAPEVDIIMLSFLVGITNPNLNLANIGNNCTAGASGLMTCPQVEADIIECQQKYGKTIMLSLGGATYTEGGFSSAAAAVTAANNVWAWFGPVQRGVDRPFGSAVVDGFDFDFESANQNMQPFVAQLRSLTNAAGGKKFYLSAAPQCVYPDAADQSFLNGQGAVAMDFIQIQFYNNYCGVGNYPTGWDYSDWDNWAKTVSPNRNAKILVGIPAASGAANSGSYTSGTQLTNALNNAKGYSSFGGVMLWDMSQLFLNQGFLQQVAGNLGGSAPAPTASPSPSPTSTPPSSPSSSPTSPPSSGSGLSQWAQCGGQGYTGPTQCAAPYKCVASSIWWSQCQ